MPDNEVFQPVSFIMSQKKSIFAQFLLTAGSKNFHRKNNKVNERLRFAILRPLFGSICLFVRSYSPLYSFTRKQIDTRKYFHNLTKPIFRNRLHNNDIFQNKTVLTFIQLWK